MSTHLPPAALDEERLKALYEAYVNPFQGRTLEQLLHSKDKLKGAEAQRLRGHFSSYCLHPADCEDPIFVADLMTGRLKALRTRWEDDLKELGGRATAKGRWEEFRDSPNQLPVVDILQVGAWTQLNELKSIPERYYECLRFLIDEIGMSVEGTDVAGYTALQHSLTCTPLLHDSRWSTILLEASPDPITAINHRNRYGTTAMHEATMSLRRPNEEEFRGEVLRWLLDRGANADLPDGDSCTPRSTGGMIPAFRRLINDYDQVQVRTGACAFCRRGGVEGKGKAKDEPEVKQEDGGDAEKTLRANLRCGRCRARNYCSAGCQKLDWTAHKKKCVVATTSATVKKEEDLPATQ